MSALNDTPRGERPHIGIFGRRNAGKSSLLNALTGQNAAVVSSEKGTTTDPVYKAMELLPLGPVVFIDTPGIDDFGELGGLRAEKTHEILRKTDVAILAVDASEGMTDDERRLIRVFEESGVKYLIVYNKADIARCAYEDALCVSAATGENIEALKERIAAIGVIDMEKRRSRINEMIGILERRDYCLEEYDDRLVRQMVEQVRVVDEDTVTVSFGVGAEYVCALRDTK